LDEQIAIAQLHDVEVRIGAAQSTGLFLKHIAFDRMRAAMCKYSGRLVWQNFSGVHDLIFNLNFVTDMLAVFDFFNLPDLFCHICLLTVFPSLK